MFLAAFQFDPALAVAMAMGFLAGITLHEAAHAYSANYLGDDTPARHGRLTLNPIAHLDLLGSIMFLIIGFGWAYTPITPSKLRGGAMGWAGVSLAGPLANLAIVAVCGGLYLLPSFQEGYLQLLIVGFAFVNALLFVFNLIPIPPLDGWRIFSPFLPDFMSGFRDFMDQYGPNIFFLVIVASLLIPQFSPFTFVISAIRPLLSAFGIPSVF